MPVISNTSPLIWLAKIGKLSLLKDLFDEVLISEESFKEAVEKGLEGGFNDALVIKEACEQEWIRIEPLDEKQLEACQKILTNSFELHVGEAQAIVLARKMGKNTLLLMDDSSGRAFAEAWGLKVKGVLYVILTAIRKELLSKAEAKEAVLLLVQKGFRIEPKLLARFLEEIDR